MRKSCYDCVRKHLGSAAVFIKEFKMGYPRYDIFVIGELEHAADECLEANRDLANCIREHRILWMPDQSHAIPFEALSSYIQACVLMEGKGVPELPKDVTAGIDMLALHGDTRP